MLTGWDEESAAARLGTHRIGFWRAYAQLYFFPRQINPSAFIYHHSSIELVVMPTEEREERLGLQPDMWWMNSTKCTAHKLMKKTYVLASVFQRNVYTLTRFSTPMWLVLSCLLDSSRWLSPGHKHNRRFSSEELIVKSKENETQEIQLLPQGFRLEKN